MDPDELVSVRPLARELGVPADWLRAEAEARRIPSLKAGRRRLFSVSAVRRALLRRAAGESPLTPNNEEAEDAP